MQILSALIAGLVFGLGLIISGMVNPAKVQNFLDIAGSWDPSLAFVMGGAIAVAAPGFWLCGQRLKPIFADIFQKPAQSNIDGRLIGGASLFGVGWGLGGFCPGPAIVSVSVVSPATMVFILCMIIGMWLAKLVKTIRGSPATA